MKVVGQAHSVVHAKGVVRVQSSMRVGTRYVECITYPLTLLRHIPISLSELQNVQSSKQELIMFIIPLLRTDKKQTAQDKVKRVENILAEESTSS